MRTSLFSIVCALLMGSGLDTEAAAQVVPPTPPSPPTAPRAPRPPRPPRMPMVVRGYLGLSLIDITPELRAFLGAPKESGVLVSKVETDSPAAKAGIAVGDLVTAVDGKPTAEAGDVRRGIRRKQVGEAAQLETIRQRAKRSTAVKVAQKELPEVEIGDMADLDDLEDLDPVDVPAIRETLKNTFKKHIIERTFQHLKNGEWQENFERFQDEDQKAEKKIKELEARLGRLEKQLGSGGK